MSDDLDALREAAKLATPRCPYCSWGHTSNDPERDEQCKFCDGEGYLDFPPLEVTYTNWRGETRARKLLPLGVRWGANGWHSEPQWLLDAFDAETGERRTFAMADMSATPDPAAVAGALDPDEMRKAGWVRLTPDAVAEALSYANDAPPETIEDDALYGDMAYRFIERLTGMEPDAIIDLALSEQGDRGDG